MRRVALLIPSVALASTACLVEPNPKFIAAQDSTTDTEGGCEPALDDPENCGSCDNRCEAWGTLLECVDGACVGTVIFTNLADAYVSAAAPDQNFGTAPLLRVSDEESTYIDLPGLDALPSGATVETATLYLDVTSVGASVDVIRVESPWDELSITEANAPALNGEQLLSFAPISGVNALEIGDLLGAWQQGNPKHSIALEPSVAGGAAVELSSREGPNSPYLVLTVSW